MDNKEPVVLIDIERMETALASETFHMPSGLTREETRQFILNMGNEKNDGNNPQN